MDPPKPKKDPGRDDSFPGLWLGDRSHTTTPDRHCGQQQQQEGADADTESTSLMTLLSSAHGRQRRKERRISKRDLQAAVKHGTREAQVGPRGEMRYKYTYADIVYITDSTSRGEITSWVAPGVGMHIDKIEITEQMDAAHTAACASIETDLTWWTSHAVVVVDQSGSMRKDDVGDYCASRSDVVWSALACTWVLDRLQSGAAESTDVMTVICMRKGSMVVIDRQPTDFVLFNKLVDLLKSSEPKFEGNYIPALDTAEEKLYSNTNGSCALQLLFFSDGRPSDTTEAVFDELGGRMSLSTQGRHLHHIQKKISKLASRFGRRLTVSTMGFGPKDEDFSVLKGMASSAEAYGSDSSYVNASLDVQALTTGLIRFSSTLSTTKTECTDLGTGSARTVRDVNRESSTSRMRKETRAGDNWDVFRVPEGGDKRMVSKATWDVARKDWINQPLTSGNAAGVAMHKEVVGEGAERMVRRFRHVDAYNEFVGEELVAKESRFVEDFGQGKDFHMTFCKTQATAQQFALAFNRKLDELSSEDNNLASLPRIQFLECSVFDVISPDDIRPKGILVEKMLDVSRYQKWNSNNGFVVADGLKAAAQRVPKKSSGSFKPKLETVYEFEEDDDVEFVGVLGSHSTASDVPQAFSHFSYRESDRKMLVCDLQGVLDDSNSVKRYPVFELTDPVIHYMSASGRKSTYGRTDRGKKGMKAFWKTHVCSPLCDLMKTTHAKRRRKIPGRTQATLSKPTIPGLAHPPSNR